MWFFGSVLILWATTVTMERWDPWVLPLHARWVWWTFCLYACGLAALHEQFQTLPTKIMGIFGYCLVVFYYTTMSTTYIYFLPHDADHPDLWATVYLTVNLLGPLVLITVGCLGPAVQRRSYNS